jgi:hypothetical protein
MPVAPTATQVVPLQLRRVGRNCPDAGEGSVLRFQVAPPSEVVNAAEDAPEESPR